MSNAKRKAQLEQIAADLERMSDRARYGVSEQTRQGWRDHARIAREIGEELVAATPEAGPTPSDLRNAFIRGTQMQPFGGGQLTMAEAEREAEKRFPDAPKGSTTPAPTTTGLHHGDSK